MKAAVLYSPDEMPRYVDIAEPVAGGGEEVLVDVKAVALKHFDKSRVKGTHYSTEGAQREATVIGGDGVCVLPDGTRVYAIGASGMMAERAMVETGRMVRLPEGLDDLVAAALPNAVFGAAMALRFRAGIEPGDTVLINGATGFTGRVAVQIARHYGAGRIIATGRNPVGLQQLLALGADEVLSTQSSDGDVLAPLKDEDVSTQSSDSAFVAEVQRIHRETPINVIIDYLWGHTAELLLGALRGKGSFSPRTRFVSVGAVTGDLIQLSAANLRSIDLQLSGSGLGSWTRPQMRLLFSEILPEMFCLAADGKLSVGTVEVALEDIEKLWEMEVPDGKRLVVRI